MQKNIKLFSFYKMFSYDILFYYAISVLFLTTVKNFSLSQIALISSIYSIYSIASILSQIPAAMLTDRIGLKNSMIIGNILCIVWGLIYILLTPFTAIVIAEVFSAFGFALKGVSETPFLYASLKHENKISELGKIEGKGSTCYFVAEAIACVASGYLYFINPYLPIIFSCTCALIATLIAFCCNPIKSQEQASTPKERLKEMGTGFKYIFKSKRLRALLLFSSVFYGILALATIFMKTFLTDLKISSTVFGYIYAILAVSSAVGSAIQDKIEKRHRNKTLTSISIIYILSFILLGLIAIITDNVESLLIIGVLIFVLQAVIKGAYKVIMKQYVSRYTTSSIRPKLMSVYYLAESFGASVMLYIVSCFIDLIDIGFAYSISGFILCIILVLVFIYMNGRVGLDPSKYDKNDRADII